MKILYLAIALVLFIVLTNPSILPLPETAKQWLSDVWSGVFGDVSEIASAISMNWISIFKVIAVVLIMALLYNITKFILSKIDPKTGKDQYLTDPVPEG